MKIRPIRTQQDYQTALERTHDLVDRHDEESRDELCILQALMEGWERSNYAINAGTPADAIRFRMAQTGLKPRDLLPFLGSKSRVSEILNGERQPTVDQIRALHQHLRIPVESLVGSVKLEPASRRTTASLAAIEKLRDLGLMKVKEDLSAFLLRATRVAPAVAMLRKTRTERTNAKTDFGALEAWCAAVLLTADRQKIRQTQKPTAAHARDLAKLSVLGDWPIELRKKLSELGIALVILEHLPGTFVDGAAMCRSDGVPVIALTLRHDRLDNFWFTLLHEYAHVVCHLGGDNPVILDDLDVSGADGIEAQADEFARNALIPNEIWSKYAKPESEIEDIMLIAHEAGVHPAIVAGRWRHQHADYRRFSRLLGRGAVREKLAA